MKAMLLLIDTRFSSFSALPSGERNWSITTNISFYRPHPIPAFYNAAGERDSEAPSAEEDYDSDYIYTCT